MRKKGLLLAALAAALVVTAPAVSVEAAEGWNSDSTGKWYEYDSKGGYYVGTWERLKKPGEDGYSRCYFDENGYLVENGWVFLGGSNSGDWLYLKDGKWIEDGWHTIDGTRYYFNYGEMAAGGRYWVEDKDEYKYVYFDKDGKEFTGSGWMDAGYGNWYYISDKTNAPVYPKYPDTSNMTAEQSKAAEEQYKKDYAEYVKADVAYDNFDGYWLKSGSDWYRIDKYGRMLRNETYLDKETGDVYYLGDDGKMITGWYSKDKDNNSESNWYYAYDSGIVANGWEKINGSWYFFNYGRMIESSDVYGLTDMSGNIHYSTSSSSYTTVEKLKGTKDVVEEDSTSYYGVKRKSVDYTYYAYRHYYKSTYYSYSEDYDTYNPYDKKKAVDQTKKVDKYYLGYDGVMLTGWADFSNDFSTYGTWRYFDDNGVMMADSWVKSGSDWYYMNSDGYAVQNSLVYYVTDKDGKSGYSTSRNGYYAYELVDVTDSSVYDKATGKYGKAKELQRVYHKAKNSEDSVAYRFDADGAMVTGWYGYSYSAEREDYNVSWTTWYYSNPDGTITEGWVKSGDDWYYVDSYGQIYTDRMVSDYETVDINIHMAQWKAQHAGNYTNKEYNDERNAYVDAHTYLLNSAGAMVTGWYCVEDSNGATWYYMNEDGTAYTGWVKSGDDWYYIVRGVMMTDFYTPDGYYVGADGRY